jgi:hypothetical protein
MYTTCLFCSGELGRNDCIEHFPVGRRLAFDASRGRLWVVCRKCERWNLTPLEERWEAIEECERAFEGTRLRVSTDQIGLARLREGLELVRIGAPQRPEMAAWRYGDQFGRRRRRRYLIGGGALLVAGTAVVAGPMLGLIGAGAMSPVWNIANAAHNIYRAKKTIAVPAPGDELLRVRLVDVDKAKLNAEADGFVLTVPVLARTAGGPWWKYASGKETRTFTGDAAIRAAGAMLPSVNIGGGSAAQVQSAVDLLEGQPSSTQLFRQAAEHSSRDHSGVGMKSRRNTLKRLPAPTRLALEMASHEESERRALEGELFVLEEAWRQADEIAKIADEMFLPASIDDELARLKRLRRGEGTP